MSDMRNVNNWQTFRYLDICPYRVNKDCRSWAKNYWTEHLVGLSLKEKGWDVSITSVDECTGDVDLNQRKGKLLAIYDMQLKLSWQGHSQHGSSMFGTIQIPEVAYDTAMEDYVFNIQVNGGDVKESDGMKRFIRHQLVPILRKKLNGFTTDLIQDYSADFYTGSTPPSVQQASTRQRRTETVAKRAEESETDRVIQTTQLELTYTLRGVSTNDVYETLLNAERASLWTQGKAKVSKRVGSKFSFFDDNVHGKQLKLVEGKSIGEAWRLKHWPKEHYSTVLFELMQENEDTVVQMVQRGIPLGQEEIVRKNWMNYYWKPIEACYRQGQFQPIAYRSPVTFSAYYFMIILLIVLLIGTTAYLVSPFLRMH
ncbi:activator of Hsp90 ATPase [Choanephora cucurbitarum]|nr:activator of Hsp90 ATPase [Choanephora cucurbitarum]